MIQFDLLAFPRILADAINILLYIPLTWFTSMTSSSSTVMTSAFMSVVKELLVPVTIPEFYARNHKKTTVFAEAHKAKGVLQVPKSYH